MLVLQLEQSFSRISRDSVVLCIVSQDDIFDASSPRPVACPPVFPAYTISDTTSILLNDY